MRIAIAQFNAHIGNFEGNLSKMLQMTETAKAQGADIICFPELATCGYPARDFLEFDDFRSIIDADAYKLNAFVAELVLKPGKAGHFLAARMAPGRPVIDFLMAFSTINGIEAASVILTVYLQ